MMTVNGGAVKKVLFCSARNISTQVLRSDLNSGGEMRLQFVEQPCLLRGGGQRRRKMGHIPVVYEDNDC